MATLQRLVPGLYGVQLSDHWLEFMTRHLLFKHVEPLEDRLVQLPPDLVTRAFVEAVRIPEQLQTGGQELGTGG
ncbi:hypothetical protein [Nocardia brasiliensis]|uniref:hypothetical protein n=1 Tax=Nocardia brasiliensis TaxID=37326 RepID=UPI001E5B9902|nr:hypothetical protein [Nocardia brasiliensis]